MNTDSWTTRSLLILVAAVSYGVVAGCSADIRPDSNEARGPFLQGTCDSACQKLVYDDHGRLLSSGKDPDCDGVIDWECEQYHYNEAGVVVAANVRRDCDIPQSYCELTTYDDQGRLLTIDVDYGCDGQDLYRCREVTYDAQGRMTSVVGKAKCYDFTEPEHCVEWTYEESKRHGVIHAGFSCDTQQVGVVVDELDSEGRWTHRRIDWGGASDSSFCAEREYDDQGRLISSSEDDKCDGRPESCYAATYAPDGSKLSEQEDWDCNRAPEVCRRWTSYEHDGLVVEKIMSNCNPKQANCVRRYYDDQGHLLAKELDPGCDGEVSSCTLSE